MNCRRSYEFVTYMKFTFYIKNFVGFGGDSFRRYTVCFRTMF